MECALAYEPPLKIGSQVELSVGGVVIEGRLLDRLERSLDDSHHKQIKVELTFSYDLENRRKKS